MCSYSFATTMADTAGMMYSIYVTSVIRYDSFVALDSKNVPVPLLQRDGSEDVWRLCYMIIIAGLPLLSSKQISIVSGFVKPYEPQMSTNIVVMKSSATFTISALYSWFGNSPP